MLAGSIAHQSALASLTAYANYPPIINSPIESSLRRTCGIEMQQFSNYAFHGISIPQNQNNNDSQFTTSAPHCQSQIADIVPEKLDTNTKRIRKSSAHI
jgi:hypothetical protein